MKKKLLSAALCSLVVPGAALAGSQSAVTIDDLVVVAANAGPAQGDVSILPAEDALVDEGDLFGLEGGYVHPYIGLQGEYTDNVFNIDTDTTSSWITTISPGIWFAMPRKKIIPISLATNNMSPGGLQYEIADYAGGDKVLLYGLAGADIMIYSEDSDLDTQDYFAEGLGRYNMASGLSLQLVDRFTRGHDRFEAGTATADNLREYDSNMVMATADWEMTPKLRAKVDYSNFLLDYDEAENDFLDRTDNTVDLYGYYKYSPKTSIFLQYRYVVVEYDTDTDTDNTQDFYFAGFRWDTTDKLSLRFKAGLQDKSYDNLTPGYEDTDGLALDFQMLYYATEKTRIRLDFYNTNEESDSADASDKDVFGLRFGYEQHFTEKITGKFDFSFENDDYSQLDGGSPDEDRKVVRPSLPYPFQDWMMGEVAYTYDTRDSDDDFFDYDTNIFYVGLNFGM